MKTTLGVIGMLLLAPLPGWADQTGSQDNAADFSVIKPVLTVKCAVCHAAEAKRPFTSKIPLWNFAAGSNIKLAREKYDIDPLMQQGEAADIAQMKILEHIIAEGKMPPFQYRLFRPGMKISKEERAAILDWIYSKHPDWKPAP